MKQQEGSVSRSSRSQSARTSTNVAVDFLQLKSGSLFPFFDQVTQRIELPFFIYGVLIIWLSIQNATTVLWITDNPALSDKSYVRQLCEFLFLVTTFTPFDATSRSLFVTFLIVTIVLVLSVVFIGALLISFTHRRRFVNSLLYIARFLIEVIPFVMAFPAAGVAGLAGRLALETRETVYFLYFLFAAVDLAAYCAIFYVSLAFLGNSPYLTNSPFAFFNTATFRRHSIAIPVYFVFQLAGAYFGQWLRVILIIGNLGLSAFFFYGYAFHPFISDWINIAFQTTSVYEALMDIVAIVFTFIPSGTGLAMMILIFLLIGVAGVLVFVFRRNQARVTDAVLMADADDPPQGEEDAFRRFEELGVARSEVIALYYLNYACAHHHMRFFDFTFMKYICQRYRNAYMLAHSARLIAWLPYCARPLNFLCSEALARRDLNLAERFILFQLERIRLLRESSSSNTAAEKLTEVKTASMETAQLMRAFWERNECSMALLNKFAKQLSSTDSLWHEAIEDFPNSVQFRDAYITYLIEAAGRYAEAVFQKSRAEMIENGTNFRVDDCFRRFVWKFPEYLKRGIVDTKGNLVKPTEAGKSDHATSSSNAGSAGVLDAGMEEGIGKQIIVQARVRLTVERAFEDRRPTTFTVVVYTSIFCTVVCIACFVVANVYFSSYFDARGDVAQRVSYLNNARVDFYACLLAWVYFWGNLSGTIRYDSVVKPLVESDLALGGATGFFFPPDAPWDQVAIKFNVDSRSSYDQLMRSIVTLAQTGTDVIKYAEQVFSADALRVRFCTELGEPATWFSGNMRTVWTYLFMQESMFKSLANPALLFTRSEPICVLLTTLTSLTEPLIAVRVSLSSLADSAADDASKLLAPLKFALPGGLFVFTIGLFGLVSALYVREVNLFASLLLSLSKQVKRECVKPVRRDGVQNDAGQPGQAMIDVPGYSLPAIFNAAILIVLAGGAVVLFLQVLNISDYNMLYAYLNFWVVSAQSRKSTVVESILSAFLAIISSNPLTHSPRGPEYNYMNQTDLLLSTDANKDRLQATNKGLFQGNGDIPSSLGYDATIDRLSTSQLCQSNTTIKSGHELYRCSSGQQLMQFLIIFLQDVIRDPDRTNGVIRSGDTAELIHLCDRHLLPILVQIDDAFASLTGQFQSGFLNSHRMFFAIELVIIFVAVMLIVAYCWTINGCYDVLLTLMRRVSPAHILASEALESYLLNKSSSKKRESLTADERIIDNSADCIICMGPTGVVDLINAAVTAAFGYTPEQLLGQPLVSLLIPDQAEKIRQQIKLMADRQSAPLYEAHTTCVTDADQEVPCSLSLMAIFTDNEISSFVAILKDESALLQRQQEAEAAKKQSETLLYQILPRDIVVRLNSGEKDISFSIPSATIMFIDIVKFSEYAANLTPQEIMGNLSLVFAGFDEACARHELLIKIKLIGDVYMCAGGLFNPDIQPSSHAEQMIRFALEALQYIEEVNVKLSAFLAVRIGINSGGPILAGVLGTDKPTFDIIGDPINVAARLQSTDIPGRIQISEDTHALVAGLDFQIEFRGEVELKGKGKKKTYLVDPIREPSALVGMSPSALEDFARFLPDPPS